MAAAMGSVDKQEQPNYWVRTSPSSPAHIFRSPHHAIIALCGAAGVACFSFALLQKKAFDASLAAVLVMVCVYIYTLQSERCRAKFHWRNSFAGSKAGSRGAARSAADGTSELDLTGYATTLGVNIRNGVVHKDGSTLNKILMDALAKEYLRCVSALRCYQTTFGPLQEDPAVQDDVATQSGTVEHSGTIVHSKPPSMRSRPDPLSTTMNSMNLAMDLASLAEPAAQTPRSPAGLGGPPSPDPKRRQASSEAQPAPFTITPGAPTNTPATAPRGSGSDFNHYDDPNPTEIYAEENPPSPSPVWSMDEVKSAALAFSEPATEPLPNPAQPVPSRNQNLGLFGGSRR